MWLSGLSTGLRTERLPVQFPVRAHDWVAGQVPRWGRATVRCFSFSLFLPPFPSLKTKNKKLVPTSLLKELINQVFFLNER